MKKIFLFLFLIISSASKGQKLSGTWQGVCSVFDSLNPQLSTNNWFYLEMNIVKGMVDGKIRHETGAEGQYFLYNISGKTLENRQIEIYEVSIAQKSKNAVVADKQQFNFTYDSKKDYLIGKSKDGKSTLTLYRAVFNIQENTSNILPFNQLAKFQQELKDGLSSPEKRKEELRSFKFEPIYFSMTRTLSNHNTKII